MIDNEADIFDNLEEEKTDPEDEGKTSQQLIVELIIASLPSLDRLSEESREKLIEFFTLFTQTAQDVYKPEQWKNRQLLNMEAIRARTNVKDIILSNIPGQEATSPKDLKKMLDDVLIQSGLKANSASMLINRVAENIFEVLSRGGASLDITELRRLKYNYKQQARNSGPIREGRQTSKPTAQGLRRPSKLLKQPGTSLSRFQEILEQNRKKK